MALSSRAGQPLPRMNAVHQLTAVLPRQTLRRLARRGASRPALVNGLVEAVARKHELSLAEFLNALRRNELTELAAKWKLDTGGSVGALRARLWLRGAEMEAGGRERLGSSLQPVPVVLGGKLVLQGECRGLAPPAADWPRPVPASPEGTAAVVEPGTIAELLDRATQLLGTRLGEGGRNKGAHGSKVAALLGVVETGRPEPDFQGEVEVKTVPVVRDRSGWWRVKEDPAISMEGAAPLAKLRRVLWIARAADEADSPLLSWYFLEWDSEVAAMVARYLHRRPKGGAGATTRGWYLQKRFFAECGFLRTLNG